jgi:hypothetical protein
MNDAQRRLTTSSSISGHSENRAIPARQVVPSQQSRQLNLEARGFTIAVMSRKAYYYHLKKCGGTSLNSWLDLQVEDDAARSALSLPPLHGYFSGEREQPETQAFQAQLKASGVSAFYWSDIIHSHLPIRSFAPDGTFCFTVLREPVNRLISQVADWRRLTSDDRAGVAQALRACMEDAQKLRLLSLLEKHSRGAGRYLLDNYLVRALAATRLGPLVLQVGDAAELLPAAIASLEQDFDLVGLAEHATETRNSLCAHLGWAPAPEIPHLNSTSSLSVMREEANEASTLLSALTQHDAALYERARWLFEARCRPTTGYDLARFEDGPAQASVQRLRGTCYDGRTAFSVRQPLVGYGFHGRDAAGTDHCAVWTGPGTVTRLYMPAPAHTELCLFLWIRGYANEAQRETVRVRVDGQDVPHRFEYEDGYRDRLAVDVIAHRAFITLEIELDRSLTSGQPGQPGSDHRPRGICFDRYGWAIR